MSTRSDFLANVSDNGSDSGSTSYASYPSYSLVAYLQSPPASAIERLVANQTSSISVDHKTTATLQLQSWQIYFDRAAGLKD
ncbi:hypothetical protein F5Y00DRAFT_224129 [Daldinia vernicosa]|uniref:uncharacterized protein n=1 Tax=Daldinia vernicosa TaxID=114800 RepID=UPI002007750E|nr:uncharacterized protein F5Y00DRAFT_224129 [Daldinia vernicosa]KAI0853973.1 hypothetical protein F5Y00DRAFT_224129 [Daldinia vernicosa]